LADKMPEMFKREKEVAGKAMKIVKDYFK